MTERFVHIVSRPRPIEFGQPGIDVAAGVDSRGRLFLGDRGNNRIQVFDQDFIDQWVQFSSPSGVYFDKKAVIYVADGGSGSVDQAHGDWKRGGSATQERHGDSSVLSG